MKSKRVLITGGFGYVGSCLTPKLIDEGYQVSVLDLNLYGDYGLEALSKEQKKNLRFIRGDIRDPDTVSEAMTSIDCVIHLAAISNDPTGQLNEVLTRQVNFDAVGLLLSIAKRSGVKRFINASSSSVFGLRSESNITERLEPEPITFYSKYKMLSEWIVRSAASKDFCCVSIRPATICGYSPRQRFDLTVNKLTADGVRKKLITVHGGTQRRPNVGMTDIVELYSKLIDFPAEKINGQTFNFGFENLSILEIAKLIKSNLEKINPAITVTDTSDLRDYHICSDKIVNNLGISPISSIAKEVESLRNRLEGGFYPYIDEDRFYNMKLMDLALNTKPYEFLGTEGL